MKKHILISCITFPLLCAAAQAKLPGDCVIDAWKDELPFHAGYPTAYGPVKPFTSLEGKQSHISSRSLSPAPFVEGDADVQPFVFKETPAPLDVFLELPKASSAIADFFPGASIGRPSAGPVLELPLDEEEAAEIESYGERSVPLAHFDDEWEDVEEGYGLDTPIPAPELDSREEEAIYLSPVELAPAAPAPVIAPAAIAKDPQLPTKIKVGKLEKTDQKVRDFLKRAKYNVRKAYRSLGKLFSSKKPKPLNLRQKIMQQRQEEAKMQASVVSVPPTIAIGDLHLTVEKAQGVLAELEQNPHRLAEYQANKNLFARQISWEQVKKGEISREDHEQTIAALDKKVEEVYERTPSIGAMLRAALNKFL